MAAKAQLQSQRSPPRRPSNRSKKQQQQTLPKPLKKIPVVPSLSHFLSVQANLHLASLHLANFAVLFSRQSPKHSVKNNCQTAITEPGKLQTCQNFSG